MTFVVLEWEEVLYVVVELDPHLEKTCKVRSAARQKHGQTQKQRSSEIQVLAPKQQSQISH